MNLKGKKVLVTGAGGFIGSHLVETLVQHGCEVRAFVHYNSSNGWGWIDALPTKVSKEIEVCPGDIRDRDSVRRSVKGTELIFHLAALIGIPYSYQAPESYLDTNIKGTLNILSSARDLGISKVLITSTSEVYGTACYVPMDEKHPRQPQSPYSASKIAADSMALSFYNSFNLPLVVVRPFNTYGPRQSARAVIPTLITQLLQGKNKIEVGNMGPTRDFTYVEDTCLGFLALAKCDKAIGKEVNVGSGHDISIGHLSKSLSHIINPSAQFLVKKDRKRPVKSEVERLKCDAKLIQKMTKWKPQISLEEGLQRTVSWFRSRNMKDQYKTAIYNI